MARDSHTSDTVDLKVVGSTKLHVAPHGASVAEQTVSGPAAACAVPVPSLRTCIEVIDDCTQLVYSALRRIEILTERNAGLQAELIALTRKEEQSRHLAYHDGLTGLPNRGLLLDRFHQAVSQAERHHKPLALLMIDLNDFKRVNDKLGHASGDKVLQAVALRLTKGIRGADTACRYGGDEFVMMLPEIDGPTVAATLAVEVGRRLGKPYIVDGYKIHMAASIGVAVYPLDGQSFDELMKQADIAMYRTKGAGRSISVTEQPKKKVSEAKWRDPPAPRSTGQAKGL